ncbi:MAG: hypothetical protein WCE73_19270, partial [Candidatus Angelobacter sp.]
MKLTQNQAKQIRALKSMKDEDIDFTDIPEKTDWTGAVVGKFYSPIKKLVAGRTSTNKKLEGPQFSELSAVGVCVLKMKEPVCAVCAAPTALVSFLNTLTQA